MMAMITKDKLKNLEAACSWKKHMKENVCRSNILPASRHIFAPFQMVSAWSVQILELLCCHQNWANVCTVKWHEDNSYLALQQFPHHFRAQTSSAKWRLRRSKCRSMFSSSKLCASCSVNSMALRAFPSNAQWKIARIYNQGKYSISTIRNCYSL